MRLWHPTVTALLRSMDVEYPRILGNLDARRRFSKCWTIARRAIWRLGVGPAHPLGSAVVGDQRGAVACTRVVLQRARPRPARSREEPRIGGGHAGAWPHRSQGSCRSWCRSDHDVQRSGNEPTVAARLHRAVEARVDQVRRLIVRGAQCGRQPRQHGVRLDERAHGLVGQRGLTTGTLPCHRRPSVGEVCGRPCPAVICRAVSAARSVR